MYVDDVLSGADSITSANAKVSQLDQLLTVGGFLLQKWTSNNSAVLADIHHSRLATIKDRDFQFDSYARALGLSWRPFSDVFVIQPSLPDLNIVTKRAVLSRVAKIFDPLGWITPITITAKMFLQTLWKLKVNWDDPLPKAQCRQWMEFQRDLNTITITIPRWLGYSSHSTVELHGFSDASQNAIGAVIYLRILDDPTDPRTSLIVSKSKVAPLKPVTIPRLELSAAVLLTRLLVQVQRALKFDDVPIHLWIDSSVALAWIQGQPARWKEFVANRVALIHELAPTAQWRHVAGTDNPADYASRGVPPHSIADHTLWWNGPPWLLQPSTSWPSSSPLIDPEQDLEERPLQITLATTTTFPYGISVSDSPASRA